MYREKAQQSEHFYCFAIVLTLCIILRVAMMLVTHLIMFFFDKNMSKTSHHVFTKEFCDTTAFIKYYLLHVDALHWLYKVPTRDFRTTAFMQGGRSTSGVSLKVHSLQFPNKIAVSTMHRSDSRNSNALS